MYIEPNTTIKILHNVPIDNTYENTVYYADKDAQLSGFSAYTKYTVDKLSYQRTGIGSFKIQLAYADLYDCNYLIFKNTSFENKWFYAFITGVSYVSNEVSEVYYQIDVMQTWCYDYKFLSTFVQRRHSDDDELYGNTQPEGLELGSEYSINNSQELSTSDNINYVILTSDIPSLDISNLNCWRSHNELVNNVYTGLYVFGTTDTNVMHQYLQAIIDEGKEGAVVAFYMAPTGNKIEKKTLQVPLNETLDGYTPRNKKLFTSPFNRIMITNNEGITNELKYEYFMGTPAFLLTATSFPQAASRVAPINYGVGTTQVDQAVVYTNYPMCGFAGDTFKAWKATNANQYAASMAIVGRTYDTNRAIAQNNYAQAERNAQLASENANASIQTGLQNAQNSFNTQQDVGMTNLTIGTLGNALSAIGDAASGNVGGIIDSAGGIVNGITGYVTGQMTAQTNLGNTQNTAATNQAIAARNLTNAMQNAAMTQKSAQLSNLTSKQNSIDMLVAKKQDIQNTPDSSHGNGLCDALNYADNVAHIEVIQQSVTSEYAAIIDSYFDMFGYAQNKLYNGNDLNKRINRPHYTYLRTMGAAIQGQMNQTDIAIIKGIYDNGITTWDTLEDVGHYELDNKPKAN